MYYTYQLECNAARERGIVGYRELPDLLHDFRSMAKDRGACHIHNENGDYVAIKGDVTLTLSFGTVEESFPCRRLRVSMEEMMSRCFGE